MEEYPTTPRMLYQIPEVVPVSSFETLHNSKPEDTHQTVSRNMHSPVQRDSHNSTSKNLKDQEPEDTYQPTYRNPEPDSSHGSAPQNTRNPEPEESLPSVPIIICHTYPENSYQSKTQSARNPEPEDLLTSALPTVEDSLPSVPNIMCPAYPEDSYRSSPQSVGDQKTEGFCKLDSNHVHHPQPGGPHLSDLETTQIPQGLQILVMNTTQNPHHASSTPWAPRALAGSDRDDEQSEAAAAGEVSPGRHSPDQSDWVILAEVANISDSGSRRSSCSTEQECPDHLEPINEEADSAEICIQGIGKYTSEETLRNYFQNSKRSGGGKIKDIRSDKARGTCHVTFGSADVALHVVCKRNHVVDGMRLNVTTMGSSAVSVETSTHREPLTPTVVVRDFNLHATTEDLLQNYFQSSTSVKISSTGEKATGLVSYRTNEDAEEAVSRVHILGRKPLTLDLNEPPDLSHNVFCLEGLRANTIWRRHFSEDFINHLESRIGHRVLEVSRGIRSPKDTVVVTFEEDMDLSNIQKALESTTFDDCKLTVKPVPVTCTVEVQNLPRDSSLSVESLTNYFQNTQKSGGRDVTKVYLPESRDHALVTFDDPEVCADVTKRVHKLRGKQLIVNMFFDCVGLRMINGRALLRLQNPAYLTEPERSVIVFLSAKAPGLLRNLNITLRASDALLYVADSDVLLLHTSAFDPHCYSKPEEWLEYALSTIREQIQSGDHDPPPGQSSLTLNTFNGGRGRYRSDDERSSVSRCPLVDP